ncbi:MAG: penicillin-binding protein activator [Candidatus ainarchaeum sp.]|nr:penicillin-binding protein activator [Candidatus ainarchaeum sp.]
MRKVWLIGLLVLIVVIVFVLLFSTNSTNDLKIGALLPMTGVESRQGDLMQKGVNLAIEELKTEGKDVEFYLEDTKSTTKDTLSEYNYLIDKDITAFFTLGSPNSILLQEPIKEDNKILFAIAASAKYTTNGLNTFRVQPSAVQEGKDLAKLAYANLNLKNIAIIYKNDDYGLGVKNAFEKPYLELGGNVSLIEQFNESTDVKSTLLKIDENVDAIYIGAFAVNVGEIAKQARELGLKQQILCGQACQNPDLMKTGGNATDGIIFSTTFLDKNTEFYKKYKEKYSEEPAQISWQYYNLTNAYAKIYSICKDDVACTAKKFKDSAITTNFGVSFDENGETTEKFVLYTIKEGQFELYPT